MLKLYLRITRKIIVHCLGVKSKTSSKTHMRLLSVTHGAQGYKTGVRKK